MDNEIKETLDRLNKIAPYADVPKELAYMTTNITPQECKILLDYITNLQQRIEKAIEYIENTPLYEETYDYNMEDELEIQNVSDETASNDLLNILRGKDNE